MGGSQSDNSDAFIFDARALGPKGLAELQEHFRELGFSVDLDANAASDIKERGVNEGSLESARKVGKILKKSPEREFKVAGLKRPLLPFQRPAVAHLVGISHAANFSVPGSGKTSITLAAYIHERSKKNVSKLVVIGPRSSFAPWESEYGTVVKRPGKIVRIIGSQRERRRAWRIADEADLVLLNYHTAPNDLAHLERLLSSARAMLVLDESHYMKNIGGGRWSTTLQKIAPLAAKRVILSGTPAPNSLADLWSQLNFLYPDLDVLGSKDRFRYRVNNDADGLIGDVTRALDPLFWRVRKSDLGLPKPTGRRIHVEMGPIQKGIYIALSTKILCDITSAPEESARLRMWRRAKMIRLLQASSNPVLLAKRSLEFRLPPLMTTGIGINELIDNYSDFEIPEKIKRAVQIATKVVSAGRRIIIWTSFVHNIRMLEKLLKDVHPLLLYGGVPLNSNDTTEMNRERVVALFIDLRSKHRVLIANPAACAESISLHMACHDAVYLDRTFNCAHFIQSKDRIHRVGLPAGAKIRYYYLVANGTIDEVVDARLEEKQRRMLDLLEGNFGAVDLELGEDVVSEEGEEERDFSATLAQLKRIG